ncbi:outer membrane beta-barrel domain-containing protein [Myxococcota bacterium]|jgi:outer membrane beta-barrel protein|nr:outer membrane beta-barrel domain-containing protein [Myxococcota bacterium]
MNGRWAFGMVVGLVVLTSGVSGLAQEAATEAPAEERTTLDRNLDRVWGKEREVRVIQKRIYEKDQRHEIGLLVGIIPNDSFFNYFPVGLRYDYFFLESVAIEVAGAYVPSTDSNLRKDLLKFSGNAISTVQIPERVQWYAGLNAFWAPIHGKLSIFNAKLTSFDIGVLIGLGVMGSQIYDNLKKSWTTRWSYDGNVPFNLMMNLGLGAHLFLTDYLALRLDYRHYIFPAYPGKGNSEWSDGVRSLAEITLGLGYLTPAPK